MSTVPQSTKLRWSIPSTSSPDILYHPTNLSMRPLSTAQRTPKVPNHLQMGRILSRKVRCLLPNPLTMPRCSSKKGYRLRRR